MKLLEKLYLIPIIGYIIAVIWLIADIDYVETMNPKIVFYGGMICHALGMMILMLIILI